MTTLYDRRWKVTLAGVDVSGLDMSFEITRTSRQRPNSAVVRIANLAPTTRSQIEGTQDRRLVVRAGYAEQGPVPPTLFAGQVSRRYGKVRTEISGANVTTTVEASDQGINDYVAARVSRSYGAGTPLTQVLGDLVTAMQIGRGNLDTFGSLPLANGQTAFPAGFVASGSAREVLDGLLRGAGLRWSIQNGALQVRQRGRGVPGQSVVISPQTGLVGSPTRDAKKRADVGATVLLQPGLDPGGIVTLQTRLVTGAYRVREVRYVGDTRGSTWHANLRLRAI